MDPDGVEEIKHHLSVVAEGLRSDVRAVAEAVSAHREEFRREIVGVRTELNEIKTGGLQDLRARVERLEERRVS